jgi:hypothetical protein
VKVKTAHVEVLAFILILVGLTLVTLFGAVARANAGGPWYVDDTYGNDSADCLATASACATIGEAVSRAENGDTIHVLPGIYVENIEVNGKDLSFVGAGAAETVVDGGGIGRVFYIRNASVTISGMTIQNGWTDSNLGGAGINTEGSSLTLTSAVLRDNVAENGAGGALRIYNFTAPDRLSTVTDTVIEDNVATQGGGLFLAGGTNELGYMAVVNNRATEPENGAVRLMAGDTTMTNVTVSGNEASGIHISNFGVLTTTNSTIAHNDGLGLSSYGSGAFQNTIFAANNGGGNNCFLFHANWYESQGNNLDSGDSCALDQPDDLIDTDPELLPLTNNGGDTLTHALAATSPAIDAGANVHCAGADQRGVIRPQDGDDDSTKTCDIGAFEFATIPVVGVTLSGPTAGNINSNYTFQAAVEYDTATQPITYTWEATGQAEVVQQGGITDTVSFTWADSGVKTVSVTADNGLGQVVTQHQITLAENEVPVTGVTISGPTEGVSGEEYLFSAEITPSDATLPITWTWEVDGHDPVTRSGGPSDDLAVSWDEDGVYNVKVTVSNALANVSDQHTITLSAWYADANEGDDSNDCQSAATACKTIQAAVDRAPAGAVVNIAAGTYQENVVVDHALQLRGAGAGQTIIDGGQNGAVLTFTEGTLANFDATLSEVTIQSGSEGGLINEERLTATGIIVQSNDASGGTGAVRNSGTLIMSDSTLNGNTSSGTAGLFNSGTARVSGVTISNNASDNTSAVHTQGNGTTSLTNVTISGNQGPVVIVSTGSATVEILNSTIADNGGTAIASYATVTVQNSILDDNGTMNCSSHITSLGNNLEDGDTCGFQESTDLVNTDPLLEPLADNGGPTLTHALEQGSPAIDAGSNAACPDSDQRGHDRPLDGDMDGNAVCDIGALEYYDPYPYSNYLPFLIQ